MNQDQVRPSGSQIGLLFEWSFEEPAAKASLEALYHAGLSPASLLLPAGVEVNAETPALIPWLQSLDIAVLFRGPTEALTRLGGDGLHLKAGADLAACRGRLGEDYILGVECGLSRHDAMKAGEAGADYIALGSLEQVPEDPAELVGLLTWWQELMELPVVALGARDHEMLADFAAAGADFLHVPPWLWRRTEDLIDLLSRIASPQAS